MRSTKALRLLMLVTGLVAGAGLAYWLSSLRQPPERVAQHEIVRAARVVEVPMVAVRPIARGYGVARPGSTWQAVSRVSGTVVYRHPELADGSIISAGTRIVSIDPTDYELAIAEAEAQIAAFNAERDQLDADQSSLESLLAIERDRLVLAERELERIRTLVDRGAAPAARLDEQESQTLNARKAVQELENQLALLPSRRNRLEAEVSQAASRLERARRDLTYTTITAPLDMRVSEVNVELDQFVATGQNLVSGDAIAVAEVPAQIKIEAFRRIVGSLPYAGDAALPEDKINLAAIEARVRLLAGGGGEWPGRVSRIEGGLDPRIRTAQIVITVDEPYRRADPPQRPALVKNMYVEVQLTGRPLPAMAVIPAAAVHDDHVRVLDEDDRLTLRPVEVAFRQNGLAMIRQGLTGGERVVIDDLVPATAGMAIEPRAAPDVEEWMASAADGA
jgi:multidrug efflux pump subunit AcrA (membrane-fusion protein)